MFSHKKIKISKTLYERLENAAEKAGYASTDEFIQHVLEKSTNPDAELSDQEQAERQLRGLGYIE